MECAAGTATGMLEERKALAGAGRGMLARRREAGGAQARRGEGAVSLAGQDSLGNMPRGCWRGSGGVMPLPRQDGHGKGCRGRAGEEAVRHWCERRRRRARALAQGGRSVGASEVTAQALAQVQPAALAPPLARGQGAPSVRGQGRVHNLSPGGVP